MEGQVEEGSVVKAYSPSMTFPSIKGKLEKSRRKVDRNALKAEEGK